MHQDAPDHFVHLRNFPLGSRPILIDRFLRGLRVSHSANRMPAGYGFDTGQKSLRPNSNTTRQMPRDGTLEPAEWLADLHRLRSLLKTDPGSLGCNDLNKNEPKAWERISDTRFHLKHVNPPPRPCEGMELRHELEGRGIVRRQISDGSPFFQIVQPSGANSTYQVNCLKADPVQHILGRQDKLKDGKDHRAPHSPNKKQRLKNPFSASKFLRLSRPALSTAEIEEEVPHLVPKQTKSRHSRQISQSKLNSSFLPFFGPRAKLGDGSPCQETFSYHTSGKQRGRSKTESGPKPCVLETTPPALTPYSLELEVMKGASTTSLPVMQSRTPVALDPKLATGCSHIEWREAEPMQVASPVSTAPSSDVLPSRGVSQHSLPRPPSTRGTSQASNTDSNFGLSAHSKRQPLSKPIVCPTPAPTGPLPPLPEWKGFPDSQKSKPIVIASDQTSTPDASPRNASDVEDHVVIGTERSASKRFPQKAIGQERSP